MSLAVFLARGLLSHGRSAASCCKARGCRAESQIKCSTLLPIRKDFNRFGHVRFMVNLIIWCVISLLSKWFSNVSAICPMNLFGLLLNFFMSPYATQPRGLPQVPRFVVLWRRAPSNLLVQTSPGSILRPDNWRCHLWDANLTPRCMFFLQN